MNRRGTHAYSKRPKANETKKKNNGEREREREREEKMNRIENNGKLTNWFLGRQLDGFLGRQLMLFRTSGLVSSPSSEGCEPFKTERGNRKGKCNSKR